MKNMLDFLKPAALAFFAAFVVTTMGCPGEGVDCEADPDHAECQTGGSNKCLDGPDTCTDCTRNTDCTGARASDDNRNFICLSAVGECVHICNKNSDCAGDQICESLRCRTPACVSDSDCGNEQCIDGECQATVADADVASCAVQPGFALLNTSSGSEFTLLAKDSDGNTIPYKGTVSWTVKNGGTSGDTNVVTVRAEAEGEVTVSAKVGTVECDSAEAIAYAAVESGSRVVVADLLTREPVSNATVVIGTESAKTNDKGAATFPDIEGTKTVSVFHAAYSFVTVVDTTSDDLLVFVKKPVEKVGFKGEKTADDFARLEALNEEARLALMGGSIPGNLIDINLETLVGELVETSLDLGSIQADVPLPSGAVIGLGDNMFKTEYELLATPGVRTVWGLGGNISFTELMAAAAPALGGDDIEVGPILTAIIPLLGRLQSGAVVGVDTPAPVDGKVALEELDVPLNILMRLNVNAKLPDLPSYEFKGEENTYEGAIVLGGALFPEQGLVPLGLTAGIDDNENGKIDKLNDDVDEGVLPLRLAARHSGLETGEFVGLALATSFSALLDSGSDSLVLSGLVKYLGDFKYGDSTANAPEISFGDRWLKPSNKVEIDDDSRTLTLDRVEGATFYRLDLGKDGKEWSVYFAGEGSGDIEVKIPEVPSDFSSDDRLPEAGALLQAVSTGGNLDLDFNGVVEFNSQNMNNLTRQIDAFVTRAVR